MQDEGFARLNLPDPFTPFADGDFPTPSGKCEFYSQRMADDGYDPLPTFTPPQSLASEGLVCISPPAHSFLNTSFGAVDRLRKREGQPVLRIHPQDAAVRGIEGGQLVRMANELGEVS